MLASLSASPVAVAARARAPRASPARRSGGRSPARASAGSPADSRDSRAPVASASRRVVLGGSLLAAVAAVAPAPAAHARKTNKLADLSSLSPSEQRYADDTLRLIAETSALVEGSSGADAVDAWLARSAAWQTDARLSYSPKSQGKSFLMTTKLVAYLKNSFATLPSPAAFDAANPPFDAAKTREWIGFAEGFTTGGLQGDDARAAFAKATWGNYDKSAPLNRFGLCAFGETGGTRALGVDCDGY